MSAEKNTVATELKLTPEEVEQVRSILEKKDIFKSKFANIFLKDHVINGFIVFISSFIVSIFTFLENPENIEMLYIINSDVLQALHASEMLFCDVSTKIHLSSLFILVPVSLFAIVYHFAKLHPEFNIFWISHSRFINLFGDLAEFLQKHDLNKLSLHDKYELVGIFIKRKMYLVLGLGCILFVALSFFDEMGYFMITSNGIEIKRHFDLKKNVVPFTDVEQVVFGCNANSEKSNSDSSVNDVWFYDLYLKNNKKTINVYDLKTPNKLGGTASSLEKLHSAIKNSNTQTKFALSLYGKNVDNITPNDKKRCADYIMRTFTGDDYIKMQNLLELN